MSIDVVRLIQYESGEMTEKEIVEMVAEMIEMEGFDSLSGKFEKLAKYYLRRNIIDDEGNINYIKLKEEM